MDLFQVPLKLADGENATMGKEFGRSTSSPARDEVKIEAPVSSSSISM